MKKIVIVVLLMFGVSASSFACDGNNHNKTKFTSEASKPVNPVPSTAK
jgi:hypothetical protein